MYKSIIFIVIYFSSQLIFSQKIDYKDNVLKINGKDVSIVEKKGDEYQFKNNSSSPVQLVVLMYTVKFKPDDLGTQFLKISNADKTQSVDVKPKKIKIFKPHVAMMEDLATQYKIIDENGINLENLNKFLADNANNIPEELKALSQMKSRDSLIDQNRFTLLPNLNIENKNKQIVGKIISGPEKFDFSVVDLDNNKISTLKVDEIWGTMELYMNPYPAKKYPIVGYNKTLGSPSINQNTLYRYVLEELSLNNYELGHAFNEKKSIEKTNKIIDARKNSGNLYDVDGFYITEDKTKINGKITFIAEEIQEEKEGGNIMSLSSNTGKYASIKYTNEKGKEKSESIKASNNDSFVVIQDGKEVKYYGMKPKSALGLIEKATFYTIRNQDGKITIYVSPSNDKLVLKSSKQDYSLVINDRKNNKISDLLVEYLTDCPAVIEDLKGYKYDLLNGEDLKKLVDKYNSCP